MTRRRRNIFREASAQVEGYRDKGLKRLRVERIKGRSVQTVDVIGRRVCGNRLVEALRRYLESHSTRLAESFIREDVAWRLHGRE